MKKAILFLITLLTASVFVGCSSNSDDKENNSQAEKTIVGSWRLKEYKTYGVAPLVSVEKSAVICTFKNNGTLEVINSLQETSIPFVSGKYAILSNGKISINDITYDYFLSDQNSLIISNNAAADGPVYILSGL